MELVLQKILQDNLVLVVHALAQDLLGGSPAGVGWLLVDHPLLADLSECPRIQTRYPLCYLCPCYLPPKVYKLWAILLHDVRGALDREQLIIQLVLGPSDIGVTQVFTQYLSHYPTNV